MFCWEMYFFFCNCCLHSSFQNLIIFTWTYSNIFADKVAKTFDQPTIPSNNSNGSLADASMDEDDTATKQNDN